MNAEEVRRKFLRRKWTAKAIFIAAAPLIAALFGYLTTSPAKAQTIPEPWDSVSSLTSDQRQQIGVILDKIAATETENTRQITLDLTALHKNDQNPQIATIAIASEIKQQSFVDQLLARQKIYGLLTPAQHQEADNAWNSYSQTTDIVDFRTIAARQQNDLFCWAAAFQALLNYNGVDKDQQWVADQIKGNTDPATVDPQELSRGITFFYLDKITPSNSISARAEYNAGLPGDDMLVNLILRNRMIVVNLGGAHIGVLYKVSFSGSSWTRYRVKDITYFDPLTGQDTVLSEQNASKEITGWWYCYAERYLFRVRS